MSREQELDWLGWNLVSHNHIWRPRVGTIPQLRARKPGRDVDCPEGDLEPVPRSSKARSQSSSAGWPAGDGGACFFPPSAHHQSLATPTIVTPITKHSQQDHPRTNFSRLAAERDAVGLVLEATRFCVSISCNPFALGLVRGRALQPRWRRPEGPS